MCFPALCPSVRPPFCGRSRYLPIKPCHEHVFRDTQGQDRLWLEAHPSRAAGRSIWPAPRDDWLGGGHKANRGMQSANSGLQSRAPDLLLRAATPAPDKAVQVAARHQLQDNRQMLRGQENLLQGDNCKPTTRQRSSWCRCHPLPVAQSSTVWLFRLVPHREDAKTAGREASFSFGRVSCLSEAQIRCYLPSSAQSALTRHVLTSTARASGI